MVVPSLEHRPETWCTRMNERQRLEVMEERFFEASEERPRKID